MLYTVRVPSSIPSADHDRPPIAVSPVFKYLYACAHTISHPHDTDPLSTRPTACHPGEVEQRPFRANVPPKPCCPCMPISTLPLFTSSASSTRGHLRMRMRCHPRCSAVALTSSHSYSRSVTRYHSLARTPAIVFHPYQRLRPLLVRGRLEHVLKCCSSMPPAGGPLAVPFPPP